MRCRGSNPPAPARQSSLCRPMALTASRRKRPAAVKMRFVALWLGLHRPLSEPRLSKRLGIGDVVEVLEAPEAASVGGFR